MTPDEFRELGRQMVDWIASYMERAGSLPVLSRSAPGEILAQLPLHPPEHGLAAAGGWDAAMADLEAIILPGLTHWQSPNFFGYFPCNASGPGILAEMLAAGLNVNGMLWSTSPAATELEIRVLDWMAELLDLPAAFRWDAAGTGGKGGGAIQGTASESTLIALLAARQRVRATTGASDDRLVLYTSQQAHSSVLKAAMIVGLARGPDDHRRIRLIGTDDRFAMRPEQLLETMRADLAAGLVPFYVCATVGTTSTTAIDPLPEIAGALEEAGFGGRGGWLHVDAAHLGAACICPEFRWMLRGIEHADSLCFNPHKWLLTNFDCDCFWTRDRASLTSALSITPEYLRNRASESGEVIDYRDWQIPLGRRFRALKLWLVIRHYGAEGLRAYIREHIRITEVFEGLVREDARFEIVAPRTANLVCFRLRGDDDAADRRNQALLERLNASGRLLLSHSILEFAGRGRRYFLRMAIGATQTRESHIRAAWEEIRAAASERSC
jgi:aromatic-L-amino-acid/L-tryptophan decarboxylase